MKALDELEDILANPCLNTMERLDKYNDWKEKHVKQWYAVQRMSLWEWLAYSDPKERLISIIEHVHYSLGRRMVEENDIDFEITDTEDGDKKVEANLLVIR